MSQKTDVVHLRDINTVMKGDMSGLEKFQKQLEEASKAFSSLDGEITRLVFHSFDPLETQRAIHQMETAIDERIERYRNNPLVGKMADKMKVAFREAILAKASSQRNLSVADSVQTEIEMNPTVEIKRKQRFEYMNALYEESGGNEHNFIHMDHLGAKLGLSPDDCQLAVNYLKGEGLLKPVTDEGLISITHLGIVEVETALSRPDEQTEHFPAVHNIINIHSMTNSVIQQGVNDSNQNVVLEQEVKEKIRAFVCAFAGELDNFKLPSDENADARAEIATVEAQISSPKPKSAVIAGSLKFLVTIIEKVGVSLLSSGIIEMFPAIRAYIAQHS